MIEFSVIKLVLLIGGECTGVGREATRKEEGEGFFFSLIGRRRDNQLFNFCAGKESSGRTKGGGC